MKKRMAALIWMLLMGFAAVALAEISVTKRDLSLNSELDRNVSNILVILQDGEKTDALMVASINSRTGRSVMTRLDTSLEVNVPEAGDVQLGEVYMLGDEKSRGLLTARTLNTLLNLNISTYVAFDIGRMPELVEAVGTLNMQLDEQEAEALGTWSGLNEMDGEDVLRYVRLSLPGDPPARSRGYDALMQLLYQGLNSGDLMGMLGLGTRLLSSMDTNLNPMSAFTLVSAAQGGSDRRELSLPLEEQVTSASPLRADAQAMQQTLHKEVYE